MVLLDNLEDMKQLLNSFFCRIYSRTDGCFLNGRNTASDNFEDITAIFYTESPFHEMNKQFPNNAKNQVRNWIS